MKRMCIGMVLAAAGVASAAVPLIDFESEAERKAAPKVRKSVLKEAVPKANNPKPFPWLAL